MLNWKGFDGNASWLYWFGKDWGKPRETAGVAGDIPE
jgi:hypothetical protein